MTALLSSVTRHGIATIENSWECDAAVIWSVLWNGRMLANRKVYDWYRQQGKPVIIAEVGCLRRGHTWKVAVNHVTAQGHYGHTDDLDLDRPKKLGLRLGDEQGSAVLIAAQHSRSLQTQDIEDYTGWVLGRIALIRRWSDRPIVIRPHPRDWLDLARIPNDVEIAHPNPVVGTYDDYDWHNRYHAVINHNSGPGIQAAIAGVRPVVDGSSLAYPVAVKICDVELPYVIDRSQWLIEISHTEYTQEEIAKGTWLKRLDRWL